MGKCYQPVQTALLRRWAIKGRQKWESIWRGMWNPVFTSYLALKFFLSCDSPLPLPWLKPSLYIAWTIAVTFSVDLPLQPILHTAVEVVYLKYRSDHITPLLEAFEWLCSRYNIQGPCLPAYLLSFVIAWRNHVILCFYGFHSTSSSYNALYSLCLKTCLSLFRPSPLL